MSFDDIMDPKNVVKEVNMGSHEFYTHCVKFRVMKPFFYTDSKMFWIWDNKDKKYIMVDEIDMLNSLENTLNLAYGSTITKSKRTEYINAFKSVGRANVPENPPKQWIQFKGNIFNIKTKEIKEVDPRYFFTNPIPFEIGLTSHTPTIDKLFKEWVGEKYKQTLYEIIAYCCYSDYPIQTLFCLYGTGRNGKSQFLKLIERFFERENICSTELDTLIDSRFESFKLYKKLVCTMGETNSGNIKKTSLLKKLVGGDLIGFEYKNKAPFEEYNYAKILIASNSLPSTNDTSDGFMRRWLIIDFPNEFSEGKNVLEQIPPEEYNNLAKKITEILPGLIERGHFTNQGSIEERKMKYISVSNPLPLFVSMCCEVSPDYYYSYSELYNEYVKFLFANKRRKVKMYEFKDALENEGFYVDKTSKKWNAETVNSRFIIGLKLNSDKKSYKIEDYDKNDNCDRYSTYSPPHGKLTEEQVTNGTKVTNFDKLVYNEIIMSELYRKDSVSFTNIVENLKTSDGIIPTEEKIMKSINNLLKNGDIFEAKPGRYRILK